MGTYWFTSDLHFGHRNIISFCNRPFVDAYHETPGGTLAVTADAVTTMDEAMVEIWNSQVAPEDTVCIVGDVCMGHREQTLKYIDRCNGLKLLVPGNHDHIFSGHSEKVRDKWREEYERRFVITDECFKGSIDGGGLKRPEPVVVCHFPYAPAGDYDGRYAEYHPENKGRWMIHGHVHDTWRQRGRMINVGIDAWGGRLVSRETIASMIALGPAHLDAIPWR